MAVSLTPLLINSNQGEMNTYSIGAVGWKNAYVLTANTAKTINVPTGANHVIFSCTGDFYMNESGTAVVPASDITDGTASDLNPNARYISGLTTLSVIAPANATLTCKFHS